MKLMALYLPQFHSFPENDAWWGKGYTEWTAVKRARPLFPGHIQPKEPLDGHYYDLDKEGKETLMKQAELANRYGIYGFTFYQYYFTGKKLMEKPLETLLKTPEIPLRYNICWANETWTRAWYDRKEEVLIKQEYGGEKEWEEHFSCLLPFFKDPRYIKADGKPMLLIYRTFDIAVLPEMREYFERRLKEEGFPGLYLVGGKTAWQEEERTGLVDAWYVFEPGRTLKHHLSGSRRLSYNISVAGNTLLNRFRKEKRLERKIPIEWIYKSIEQRTYEENEFPGIIAEWDNTPRRGYKGLVYTGAEPGRFETALRALAEKVEGRKNDFVFLNAWNEWGEGAAIEPDKRWKDAYLKAVSRVAEGPAAAAGLQEP
ncbi:MAG: glycoside hydrolase family 99-like domain-containing protein [Lachnospiraceae bacterium]|nr:glycoside hydrolase family 99-like domain-containing protein [Lachnospiraceae bacterium]